MVIYMVYGVEKAAGLGMENMSGFGNLDSLIIEICFLTFDGLNHSVLALANCKFLWEVYSYLSAGLVFLLNVR